MNELEIDNAIRNCSPVIHLSTATSGNIEYECIIGKVGSLADGLTVILKSKSGNSVTCARASNVILKE